MLFANDFVGVSESSERLQKLIGVVYGYCNRWRQALLWVRVQLLVFRHRFCK